MLPTLVALAREGLRRVDVMCPGFAVDCLETLEEIDQEARADFLAANISSFVGPTQGITALNVLSKDLDGGLSLYFEMLRSPGFQEDRLKLAKSQLLQQFERRNDRTDAIEVREWNRLLEGPKHFTSKQATKASMATCCTASARRTAEQKPMTCSQKMGMSR